MKTFNVVLLTILSVFMIVSCSDDDNNNINPVEEQRDRDLRIFKDIVGNTYTNPNAVFDVEFLEYVYDTGGAVQCHSYILYKEKGLNHRDTLLVRYMVGDNNSLRCGLHWTDLTFMSKDLLTNELGDWKKK